MDCCPRRLRAAEAARLRLAATDVYLGSWGRQPRGAPLLARLKHGDFYAQDARTALAHRSRGWPRPRRRSQRKELNKPLSERPLIKRSSEKLPSNASNTSAKRIGQHFIREIILRPVPNTLPIMILQHQARKVTGGCQLQRRWSRTGPVHLDKPAKRHPDRTSTSTAPCRKPIHQ